VPEGANVDYPQQFVMFTVLLLGLAFGHLDSATAAVLTVTDCGDTTPGGGPGQFRRLITDATAGDTIVVPACLITLTGVDREDANASGDLDIRKDLTIQGAGPRQTIIDGASFDRVFDIFAPATVKLAGMMIRNGFAFDGGGGIRNAGTLTLNRVIVRANRVRGGEAFGGGIRNNGALAIAESAIVGNSASTDSRLGSTIGGGIYNVDLLTLTRSTVSRNLACPTFQAFFFCGRSGGIGNAGTLAVIDSTISGNSGGIFNFNGGAMSAVGSAIVSSFSDVGVTSNGVVASGVATLTNTIIADNSGGPQCQGVFASVGGNLATDTSCGLSGPDDAVAADAGLGALADHGGPTQTHPLLPGSPAIDTALPAACSARDQRGQPRPADACDKGPFEFTLPIFADVAADHFARGAIEALWANGVTAGCGTAPLEFCPDETLTRAQLAVLLLRALEGPAFTPPPATGSFADVPVDDPYAPWIEALFNQGITSGCGVAPRRFCPNDAVTRGELAVLLLRALAAPGFVPPAATGFVFSDVPRDHPFAPWIEEFFQRGLTSGCQAAPLRMFCPDAATRAQTAVFLVRAFDLGF